MRKIFYYFLVVLFVSKVDAIAQQDSVLVIPEMYVSRIIITGNEKTKEEVISRELETKEGELLDIKKLESDINRLYNLGLFTKVDVQPLPVSFDSIIILYDVNESIYLLPIPQGGIKESSLKKIWGGVNLVHNNFRGMNEKLGLSFGIGYDPFIRASYSNPWIGKQERYSFSSNIGYSRTNRRYLDRSQNTSNIRIDDLPEYKLNQFDVDFTLNRHLEKDISLSLTAGYNFYEVTSDQISGITGSDDGKDSYLNIELRLRFDTRDLLSYPTTGALHSVSLSKVGLFTKEVDFLRIKTDYKRFLNIPISNDYGVIWANRISSSIGFGGNIPEYLEESVGQREYIRGWKNIYFGGDSRILMSTELRIPVIKPGFIDGKDIPLLNKLPIVNEFSYKYGLYFTTFFDSGTVWDKDSRLVDFKFRNGYGVGLNMILPFNIIGRLDVAWRKNSSANLFYSLNASF